MTTLTAFPPIIGQHPHTLILGTMPGVRSLEEQQYYAHPQNRFWDFMGEIFGAGRALSYEQRCEILSQNGIAVWDVCHSCTREGSLDSAIKDEAVNDFPAFFAQHPSIHKVVFDSLTAEKIFLRQKFDLPETLAFARVPSPSPAYAAMKYEEKLEKWRGVLKAGPS